MMEAEDIQFTLEQILNVHRPWITQLYVQECKTEQDIVSLLQERGFHITSVHPPLPVVAFLNGVTIEQLRFIAVSYSGR